MVSSEDPSMLYWKKSLQAHKTPSLFSTLRYVWCGRDIWLSIKGQAHTTAVNRYYSAAPRRGRSDRKICGDRCVIAGIFVVLAEYSARISLIIQKSGLR